MPRFIQRYKQISGSRGSYNPMMTHPAMQEDFSVGGEDTFLHDTTLRNAFALVSLVKWLDLPV